MKGIIQQRGKYKSGERGFLMGDVAILSMQRVLPMLGAYVEISRMKVCGKEAVQEEPIGKVPMLP